MANIKGRHAVSKGRSVCKFLLTRLFIENEVVDFLYPSKTLGY